MGATPSNVASFPALVLAGHGTRDPVGQAVAAELVAGVARAMPGIRVVPAYVDNQLPTVGDALRELAGDGVTRAVVVPLLLTAATHSKTDIAAAVHRARADLPRLSLSYGRPLGPHPDLLTVLEDRLSAAGVRPDEPDSKETAIVLAAAGAADPDANADIAKTARLLWEGRQWYAVEPAYASATRPSVPEAIDRLHRLGVRRVAVAPYFLAPGFLVNRVRKQAFGAGATVVSGTLGAHDTLIRLIGDRYREALAGIVVMNCDTCLYRAPFRGREDVVGLPLTPRREAAI